MQTFAKIKSDENEKTRVFFKPDFNCVSESDSEESLSDDEEESNDSMAGTESNVKKMTKTYYLLGHTVLLLNSEVNR